VVIVALVFNGGVRVELREVGIGIGLWCEEKVAIDESGTWFGALCLHATNLQPPPGGGST
jgi:hypothetical protein